MLATVAAVALTASAGDRAEVVVFPFTARLAVGETRQYGFAVQLAYAPVRQVAVTFDAQVDYAALARDESDFPCDVGPCRARTLPPNPHGLMLAGATLVGFELRPLRAQFAVYEAGPFELALVLGGGLGAAPSRWSLGSGRFADTGWRFAAQLGGGLRARIGRWVRCGSRSATSSTPRPSAQSGGARAAT